MGLPSISGWLNIDLQPQFYSHKVGAGDKVFLRVVGSLLQTKLEKIRRIMQNQL